MAFSWLQRAACTALWFVGAAGLASATPHPLPASPVAPPLRLMFMGDVMTGSTWPTPVRSFDPWGQWGEVPVLLAGATAAFANLEGALTDGGAPVKLGRCIVCYSFRMPVSDAHLLARVGWTALSQANNHAGDFGLAAQTQGPRDLFAAGVASDGLRDAPVAPFSHNGHAWVLLAFAPNSNVRSLLDLAGARALIRAAAATGALVVVSMHAGGEGAGWERVRPGPETYLGENRGDPVAFAHAAVDAGAAVVYGHGPHVPRALEVYRGHLIAYSLGNGMTYGGIRREGASALSPLLEAMLDPTDGTFLSGRIHSFVQRGSLRPLERDPAQEAARRMAWLTEQDRPESPLCWSRDGGFVVLPASGCPVGFGRFH